MRLEVNKVKSCSPYPIIAFCITLNHLSIALEDNKGESNEIVTP